MKKLLIFGLLVVSVYSYKIFSNSDQIQVSIDIRKLEKITPIEWFENYYLQLDSLKDQAIIIDMINHLSISAKNALDVIDEQEKALLANEDLYSIANKIFGATYFGYNVSDQNNIPLLSAAFTLMKTIFIVPQDFTEIKLQTRQDYIKVIPLARKIVLNLASKADECLQLIESNE